MSGEIQLNIGAFPFRSAAIDVSGTTLAGHRPP
jgi:hypothetical protein